MPRGYRSVVVAAFGLLILAAGPPPNKAAQSEQSSRSAAVEQPLASIAESQAALAKAADTGEYEKPCGPSGENYRSDLCAQWKAATAAAESANWAFLGLGVSIVGAAGIILSLLYTREALQLAREAARDGDAGLAIAERNAAATQNLANLSAAQFRAGFRPLLNVKAAGSFSIKAEDTIPAAVENGPRGIAPKVMFTVTNQSQMPATIIKVFCSQLDPHVLRTDSSIRYLGKDDQVTIGTGTSVIPDYCILTGFLITKENRMDVMMSPPPIRIIIIYDDAIGVRREWSFGFAPRQLWANTLERAGGHEINYDREVTEGYDRADW